MDLADQLAEAAREKGSLGTFRGRTDIPGISFKAFQRILSKVPRGDRERVVSRMGDAISNAQLHGDDKYNASALAYELASAFRGGEDVEDEPRFHDFELLGAALLFPIYTNKVDDPRVMKDYQKKCSLEMRNRHPTTSQALDRVIAQASKFIGGAVRKSESIDEAKRKPKGTPTGTNLYVLSKVFGSKDEVSNQLSPTDVSHIRRCLKAGLITVTGKRTLRLTQVGKEMLKSWREKNYR